MRLTRFVVFMLSGLAAGFVIGAVALAQSAHMVVPADKVQYAAAPPILPPGAQLAVLEGNPAEKGMVVMRLKLPANYKIPAHWHSTDERITVLSGTFNVGMGDKLNTQESQALASGGFLYLPAKMRHFAWTSSPTVVQINLEGPFDLTYVDPNDNPQTRKR
jgi:uncharacterized RmlC-like cupin family protein